jgi:hypothetical protein
VVTAWRRLAEECARRRDAGRPVAFWWRDDDAARPEPALERLLRLAESAQVPVALAVVPDLAEAALVAELSARACLLQHGCDHRNRAAPGEKKSEFVDAEPVAAALARLAQARERLAALSRARALHVLVPPWNRLSAALLPRLRRAGFRGLSRFGPRGAVEAAPGLRELNTHVDIIAWHAGRGFAGEEAAIDQALRFLVASRAAAPDGADEALGWLTHHACHDEAAWRFLERLLDASRALPGVRWITAGEFFAAGGA